MGNLDTLRIADHALDLAVLTYEVTSLFPRVEMFGLVDQMRRASVSVGSNIAEGCGRWSNPQLLHFLEMSCGSASELTWQSRLATRLRFADEEVLVRLAAMSTSQHRMTLSYANWVRNRR